MGCVRMMPVRAIGGTGEGKYLRGFQPAVNPHQNPPLRVFQTLGYPHPEMMIPTHRADEV